MYRSACRCCRGKEKNGANNPPSDTNKISGRPLTPGALSGMAPGKWQPGRFLGLLVFGELLAAPEKWGEIGGWGVCCKVFLGRGLRRLRAGDRGEVWVWVINYLGVVLVSDWGVRSWDAGEK